MPLRALLVGVRELQDRLFAEGFAQQLQADGEFRVSGFEFRVSSFGFRVCAEVKPHGMLMPQMPARLHEMVKMSDRYICNGSSDFLADLERGGRAWSASRSRPPSRTPSGNPADQRAHLLRAQVIGVVVAAAQHVGAQNDAALHFRAEPRAARLGNTARSGPRRPRAAP